MLTFEKLVEGFRALGVNEGDTLLVHSSYKSFGEVDGGPETVVRALEAALGADGTLIMPTFNFDFNKGVPWDVRKTRSKMGALTEIVPTWINVRSGCFIRFIRLRFWGSTPRCWGACGIRARMNVTRCLGSCVIWMGRSW